MKMESRPGYLKYLLIYAVNVMVSHIIYGHTHKCNSKYTFIL